MDQVQLSTYSYYNGPTQSPQSGINLASSILSVLGTGVIASSAHLGAADLTGLNNSLNPNVSQFLNNGRSYDSSRPKAYLNWVLFDDQFNYVASNSGVSQVVSGPSKQALAAPTQSITKNGYLYVYVSNESQQDVWFDNLTIKHMTGPLQQEQSYYPFGLPMAGISDKALLKTNTPYKANSSTALEEENGLEYYNTAFRKYDPQIGRFNGIDAMSEATAGNSPYHFAGNNPVLATDPTGLLIDINRIYGGPHLTGGGESDVDQTFDELDAFSAQGGFLGSTSWTSGDSRAEPSVFDNMMTMQTARITPGLSASQGDIYSYMHYQEQQQQQASDAFWSDFKKTVLPILAKNAEFSGHVDMSAYGNGSPMRLDYNYTDPISGRPTVSVSRFNFLEGLIDPRSFNYVVMTSEVYEAGISGLSFHYYYGLFGLSLDKYPFKPLYVQFPINPMSGGHYTPFTAARATAEGFELATKALTLELSFLPDEERKALSAMDVQRMFMATASVVLSEQIDAQVIVKNTPNGKSTITTHVIFVH